MSKKEVQRINEEHQRFHQKLFNATVVNPLPFVLLTFHKNGTLVATSSNILDKNDNTTKEVVMLALKVALATEATDPGEIIILEKEKLS